MVVLQLPANVKPHSCVLVWRVRCFCGYHNFVGWLVVLNTIYLLTCTLEQDIWFGSLVPLCNFSSRLATYVLSLTVWQSPAVSVHVHPPSTPITVRTNASMGPWHCPHKLVTLPVFWWLAVILYLGHTRISYLWLVEHALDYILFSVSEQLG